MKHIGKVVFMLAVVLLVLAPPTLSQEKIEPSSSQAQVSASYPDTADGLKQFLQDVLSAAKSGDTQKVTALVKDTEIPNYEAWFYKTFPAGSAKSWIGPYGANLDRNERSIRELFAQLAQEEGELFTRKVNDSPEPGKGLEWGMLQSLRQPVDIYFASWKKPDDAKDSRGDRIGYFMFIEGKFRWDSLVSFARISTVAPGESSAAPQTVPSPQQFSVQQQSEPQDRVRVAQAVSQAMILSRVQPRYPREAVAKGVQGKVNMLAVISEAGNVADLKLIDGDPLLTSAAMDAVKQWKYHPYLLQGRAVEMETPVTVIFTIAGKN